MELIYTPNADFVNYLTDKNIKEIKNILTKEEYAKYLDNLKVVINLRRELASMNNKNIKIRSEAKKLLENFACNGLDKDNLQKIEELANTIEFYYTKDDRIIMETIYKNKKTTKDCTPNYYKESYNYCKATFERYVESQRTLEE